MASDITQQAVEAFFLTLADYLPAALAARDAARHATIRLPVGPYALGAGGTLSILGETFTLTGGSRTATQVVAELAGAVAFTAAVEADGSLSRVVLTAASAPARDAPSELVVDVAVDADAQAVLDGLGLKGDQRKVELACGDPPPALSAEQPEGIINLGGRPLIYLDDAVAADRAGGGPKDRIWQALLRLQVWVPAGGTYPAEAAIVKAQEIQRGIHDVLRAGDSYSPYHAGGQTVGQRVVRARPLRLVARAKVFELFGEAASGAVAIIAPEIEILVADRTA
jgi:hypothetical protein